MPESGYIVSAVYLFRLCHSVLEQRKSQTAPRKTTFRVLREQPRCCKNSHYVRESKATSNSCPACNSSPKRNCITNLATTQQVFTDCALVCVLRKGTGKTLGMSTQQKTPQVRVSEPGSIVSGLQCSHYSAKNSHVAIPTQSGAWALKLCRCTLHRGIWCLPP